MNDVHATLTVVYPTSLYLTSGGGDAWFTKEGQSVIESNESHGEQASIAVIDSGGTVALVVAKEVREFAVRQIGLTDVAGPVFDDERDTAVFDDILQELQDRDIAILVASAIAGPLPQTREQVILARHLQIADLILVLILPEGVEDEESIEIVEMEFRELLENHGYSPETLIVNVSNKRDVDGNPLWLEELRGPLEVAVHAGTPLQDSDFLFSVTKVSFVNRRTIVHGHSTADHIRPGDYFNLPDGEVRTVVSERSRESRYLTLESVLTLDGPALVRTGDILYGWLHRDLYCGLTLSVYIAIQETRLPPGVTLTLVNLDQGDGHQVRLADESHGLLVPGGHVDLRFDIPRPAPTRIGDRIELKNGAEIIGVGRVSGLNPLDKEASDAREGASVFDVWFGTNRKLSRDGRSTFTNELDEGSVHYGVCRVNVPKTHKFGSTGVARWRTWWRPGSCDDPLTLLEQATFPDVQEFSRALSAFIRDNVLVENRILVYLHGYNTSFEQAAVRAAQMGVDLKSPGATAFFSWASYGEVDRYVADGERAWASEWHLTEFIKAVASVVGVDRIDMIVHSMGNQVFARCIQGMMNSPETKAIPFGSVFLAAPDIDVSVFKRMSHVYSALASNRTMYVSRKDKALGFSKWLQGDRAGFTPPVTVVEGVDTIEVGDIDASLLGHSYYADAEAVLYDMSSQLRGEVNPAFRLRLQEAISTTGARYWKFRR